MKKRFKKGLTLVEMIVSIAIFIIGMAGFTMLASKSWKANGFIMESGKITMIANTAIEKTASDLRKVRLPCAGVNNLYYPIQSGDGFDLQVYLDDDNDEIVERVHYFLDGQTLKKGIRKPSAGCVFAPGDDAASIKTVANYVMNENTQPIFSYYNSNYPGDNVNNPLNTAPLAIDQVKLIKIHLWINIKPLTAPDNVNFETFIGLRNLNENL